MRHEKKNFIKITGLKRTSTLLVFVHFPLRNNKEEKAELNYKTLLTNEEKLTVVGIT